MLHTKTTLGCNMHCVCGRYVMRCVCGRYMMCLLCTRLLCDGFCMWSLCDALCTWLLCDAMCMWSLYDALCTWSLCDELCRWLLYDCWLSWFQVRTASPAVGVKLSVTPNSVPVSWLFVNATLTFVRCVERVGLDCYTHVHIRSYHTF